MNPLTSTLRLSPIIYNPPIQVNNSVTEIAIHVCFPIYMEVVHTYRRILTAKKTHELEDQERSVKRVSRDETEKDNAVKKVAGEGILKLYHGFPNIGNSCYLNAALILLEPVIKRTRALAHIYQGRAQPTLIRNHLQGLRHQIFRDPGSCFKGEKSGAQQDAGMAVQYLLDKWGQKFTVQEEHVSNADISVRGKVQSEMTQLQISINTEKSLQHLLNTEFRMERKADDFRGKGPHVTFRQIEKTPDHLVIQMLRFRNDLTKNDDEMNISPLIRINNDGYGLKRFIYHQGTFNAGHYGTFVKREKDWLLFNDDEVEVISNTDIEGFLKRAYVLYYRKLISN